MGKEKEKEVKPSRVEARVQATLTFHEALNRLIVLDGGTKGELKHEFSRTIVRLQGVKLTEKTWGELKREDLWAEHDQVISQLKVLNIFSNDFYNILTRGWDNMLYTFNPNVDWYKD